MGKGFSGIIKKLDHLQKNIANEVAPEINKLLKNSVHGALGNFYNGYSPKMYHTTYNLYNITDSSQTIGSGDILTLRVDSSTMSDYPGFEIPPYPSYERKPLYADTAFEFMFENGEHGHGRWNMANSTPPETLVDKDIQSGFNGEAQKIIKKKAIELLK